MGLTKIEWTSYQQPDGTWVPGYTFNPWIGCAKVSAACAHCYAEHQPPVRIARAVGRELWGANAERQVASERGWRQPLAWNQAAAKAGERRRVFCASLADVFEDRPELRSPRQRLFRLIDDTPHLDWLLLTKRPENLKRLYPPTWDGWGEPPENVWLGTTVENQEQVDKRIPDLLKVPARVRFLSCEPLLGPVNLTKVGPERWDVLHGWKPANENYPEGANTSRVDWVIVGGESGPGARPMHPDWARSLRDQCQAAGVPFFFKQNGEWVPAEHPVMKREPILSYYDSDYKRGIFDENGTWKFHEGTYSKYENILGQVMYRVGKKAAGRLLDGVEWNEMPRLKEAA
jgi:protein gp37